MHIGWWLVLGLAAASEGVWSLDAGKQVLVAPSGASTQLPCTAKQLVVVANTAWLACDEAALRITALPDGRLSAPELVALGPVDQLQLRDGTVVPVMRDGSTQPAPSAPVAPMVQPAGGADPSAVAPAAALDDRRPLPALGRVTGVDGRRATLDVGKAAGLQPGTFVELLSQRPVTVLDETVTAEVSLGYARIEAATEDRAVAFLALNQADVVGASVRPLHKRPPAWLLGPPRVGGRGFFETNQRGIFGPGFSEGALLSDAAIGYRFKMPVSVEVRLNPLVVGGDALGGFSNGTIVGIVSFDHHWFAIGGGGGVSFTEEGNPRGVWTHRLRFGPIDGLNFVTNITLRGVRRWDSRQGYFTWEVDQIDGTWQIPVAVQPFGVWLMVRGHGGYLGGGAEIGARLRVKGNGERGTWAITPLLGGEARREDEGGSSASGPTAGLGFDVSF